MRSLRGHHLVLLGTLQFALLWGAALFVARQGEPAGPAAEIRGDGPPAAEDGTLPTSDGAAVDPTAQIVWLTPTG